MAAPQLLTNIPQPSQSVGPIQQQVSLPGMEITPSSAGPMRAPAMSMDEFAALGQQPNAPMSLQEFEALGAPSEAAQAPGTLPGAFDKTLDLASPGGATGLKDLAARFYASFGQNPKEQVNILTNKYGKGAAKLVGDEVYWKAPGQKKYTQFDADFTKAQSIMEVIADAADFAGDVTQYAPAAVMAAAPGGVLARGAFGGIGGAVGSGARSYVANQLGAQNDQEVLPRAALDSMLGALTGSLPAAVTGIKSAIQNAPGGQDTRKLALQRIRVATDDFARGFRVNTNVPYDAEALGGQVKNAIQTKQAYLDGLMEVANDKLIATSPQSRTPGNQIQQSLKKFLDEYAGRGVNYTADGNAVVSKPVNPFGYPGGDDLLKTLASEYNQMKVFNSSGGLDAKQWKDKVQFFQKLAEYDKRVNQGDASPFFAQIEKAARSDRAVAFMGKDPAVSKAFETYRTQYEPLKQFNQLLTQADQQNKLSMLAEGIFENNKPQRVRDFLTLFKDVPAEDGAPGTLFDRLKGLYAQNIIDKSIEKNGIFNGYKMLDALKDSTAKVVLNDSELGQLKMLANRAKRIKTGDITQQQDFIRNVISKVPFFNKMLPSTQATILADITDNSPALLNMLDDSALAEIRKLPLSQQENYFKVAKKLEDRLAKQMPKPDVRSLGEKIRGNLPYTAAPIPAEKKIKELFGVEK